MQGYFFYQDQHLYFQSQQLSYKVQLPHTPARLENIFFETLNNHTYRNLKYISDKDKELTLNIFKEYGFHLYQQIFPKQFQYIVQELSTIYFQHDEHIEKYCFDFLYNGYEFLKLTNPICHLLNTKFESQIQDKKVSFSSHLTLAQTEQQQSKEHAYLNTQNTVFWQVINQLKKDEKNLWSNDQLDDLNQNEINQTSILLLKGLIQPWLAKLNYDHTKKQERFSLIISDHFNIQLNEFNSLSQIEQSLFYLKQQKHTINQITHCLQFAPYVMHFQHAIGQFEKDLIYLILNALEQSHFTDAIKFSVYRALNNYKKDLSWLFYRFYTTNRADGAGQESTHWHQSNKQNALHLPRTSSEIEMIPKYLDSAFQSQIADFILDDKKDKLLLKSHDRFILRALLSTFSVHQPNKKSLHSCTIDCHFDLFFFKNEKENPTIDLNALLDINFYFDLLNLLFIKKEESRVTNNENTIVFLFNDTLHEPFLDQLHHRLGQNQFKKIVHLRHSISQNFDRIFALEYIKRWNALLVFTHSEKEIEAIALSNKKSKSWFYNVFKNHLTQEQLQIVCILYLFGVRCEIVTLKQLEINFAYEDLFLLHELDLIHYNVEQTLVQINQNFQKLATNLNLFSQSLLFQTSDDLLIRFIKFTKQKSIVQFVQPFYNIIYRLHKDYAQLCITRLLQYDQYISISKVPALKIYHFIFMLYIAEKHADEALIIKIAQLYAPILNALKGIQNKLNFLDSLFSRLQVYHDWALFAKLLVEKSKIEYLDDKKDTAIATLRRTKILVEKVGLFQDYCWLFEEIFTMLFEIQADELGSEFLDKFTQAQFNAQKRMQKNWLIVQALTTKNQNEQSDFDGYFLNYQKLEQKVEDYNILDLKLLEMKLSYSQNEKEQMGLYQLLAEIEDILDNTNNVEKWKMKAFNTALKLNADDEVIKNGTWLLEKAQEDQKKGNISYFANKIGKAYFELGNQSYSSYYYKLSKENI